MAQKRRRQKKAQRKYLTLSQRSVGVIYMLLAILGFFALGYLGDLLANVFRLLVGDFYKGLFAVLFGLGFYLLLKDRGPKFSSKRLLGFGLFWCGLLTMRSAVFFFKLDLHTHFIGITWQYLASDLISSSVATPVGGGLVGAILYTGTYFLVSQLGSYLLADMMLFCGFCLFFEIPLQTLLDGFGWGLDRILFLTAKSSVFIGRVLKKVLPAVVLQGKKAKKHVQKFRNEYLEDNEENAIQEFPVRPVDENIKTVLPKEDKVLPEPVADLKQFQAKVEKTPVPEEVLPDYQTNENYQLPPLDLLSDGQDTDQSDEKKAILKNKDILVQTLESFGVKAELKNIILGPAVTRYELHPAIGVKVSKIVSLADDLALALAAKDIRIEAPIPGKSLIGIEVPNKNVATVAYKTIMTEFKQQKKSSGVLEVPIGHDIAGELATCDLAKMPHLLIAGSTGSGKSVAINVIITSLLMNCRPEMVKLMMVDPKKVELGIYKDLPHLLVPVITEPKKAARSLEKVVARMEQRYETFAQYDVRNIKGYNQLVLKNKTKEALDFMPYIVVVVDELADLMMTTGGSVQDQIVRIAQMGRAAGIHMILATQRPSVDVITGLIKANVPSRMAFAVSSGTDSRTILDGNGAEKLLGRGDMLFMPIGQNKPTRIQGAFISDHDVSEVVQFVASQQKASFDTAMEVSDEEVSETDKNDDVDELFDDVVAFIAQEQKCSISMLQRKFSIGYNRSARIVDELEMRGMVGKQEGAKPRKVYLPAPENQE